MRNTVIESEDKPRFQIPIIEQYQQATRDTKAKNTKQLFIMLVSSFAVMGFLMLNINSMLKRQELRKYATDETASLSIQPQSITSNINTAIPFGILLSPRKKVTGITLSLVYNKNEVEIKSIQPGPFFTRHKDLQGSLKVVSANTEKGMEISYAFPPESKFSYDKSDIAVNLTMKPLHEGTIKLSIDKTKSKVIDLLGKNILATVSGSIITVQ
jgi:hypothetical protein